MSPIIGQYDTILFDMDGVITSEENYWDVSALAVYEMLHSSQYFGDEVIDPEALAQRRQELRQLVFDGDRTIRCVKNYGINSNWDLTYVTLGAALILGKPYDYARIYQYLRDQNCDAFTLYRNIGLALSDALDSSVAYTEREGGLWQATVLCFQEWFLGGDRFAEIWHKRPVQPGKRGLMYDEEPLVDKARLIETLAALCAAGKRLGIGTGRPKAELDSVLDRWDIRRFFDPESVITYTDVMEAEERLRDAGQSAALTKPHPFMFLKGVFGRGADDVLLAFGEYDRQRCARTLVVGDAGADLYAAHAGGCAFCAVMTGIQGEAARPFFEREGADYMIGSVLELLG